jgi:hypothetical protein
MKLVRVLSLCRLPVGIVLAFLGTLIVSPAAPPGGGQAIRNRTDLANDIIEKAKSGDTVDLTWLGDNTCFVPEKLYAPGFAKEWFPGYYIKDDQWRDESNGVWHIIVSNDKERVVRIYSIDQNILRWNVPEETKIADATGCKRTVKVVISGTSAEITIFDLAQH